MRRLAVLLACLALPAADGAQADPTCLAPPWEAQDTPQRAALHALLTELRPVLARHPSLEAALLRLTPTLCLAPNLREAEGYLDADTLRIVLGADAPVPLQAGILLHELRHLDQFARGFCPSSTLTMRENARATFALEADASAVGLLVAWDMRAHGAHGPWEALAAWPQQADIAARLAEVMAATDDPAAAAAAAFAQWYARPGRLESYYLASCSDYLDRLDTAHLLPGQDLRDPGFLERLCRLPDDTPYPCVEGATAAAR